MLTDTGNLSEASSAPRIDTIRELGGGDVILTAPVNPGAGDGMATVGEALWIRGSNFGRQPTVTIAGRPAAVLARTTDGGVVARVPPGVPVGAQTLSVSHLAGRGDYALNVRRLVAAMSPAGGRMMLAALTQDGPLAAGEVSAAGNQVRVTADGRAAYVLDTGAAKITVFELPAQGGPRAGVTLDLDARGGRDPVIAFAAASGAATLMIIRGRDLLLLDTTAPLRPLRSQPRALP
ncbi:MAG: IPT/TIG domain-containing protein, partial [Deltaproteobacteria bacterium]|nr:IPT/TIG domain-containing protein [Deltaproteobacteria bacterium]